MAAGLRFLPKPWRFLHQLNTEFSRLPRTAIPACRLSSTTSKTLLGEEAQAENWRRRVDLAASYRILEKYNLHEGVCNHLSMMAPAANGDGEVMLVIPYGLHWSEVKASSFVGLNVKREVVEGEGEADIAASTIHMGVHRARPDAVCAFHVHPPYCTALGIFPNCHRFFVISLGRGFPRVVEILLDRILIVLADDFCFFLGTLKNPELGMHSQNACMFYNQIAYDRVYSGPSVDEEEGMRTAKQLGDKSVLFMCNHGVLVVAPNAARAMDHTYYLERACMNQVLAMSTGQELFEIPDEVAKFAYEQIDGPGIRQKYCDAHFEGMKRILSKECPDFME